MTFVLPPKSQVGYRDSEIAGEGQKVIMSDGDVVTWTPPPEKLAMPDWSQVKSLRKYFGRVGMQAWPAWIYHPTEPARLLKNAHEAAELGICYRETTADEQAQFGGMKHRWDWKDDCKWRPRPYNVLPFDPKQSANVKNLVVTPANPIVAQDRLIKELVPLIAATVIAAMKGGGGPPEGFSKGPADVDPAQWEKFLQFQAWQNSTQTVDALVEEAAKQESGVRDQETGVGKQAFVPAPEGNALASDERAAWEEKARLKGIRVDTRWSLETLKQRVEKAA